MQKTKIEYKIVLSVAVIIIFGFAVYINSLQGKFVWDDNYLIEDNIYIRNFSNVFKIFTVDIFAGADIESNFYRPFQILTYMVDYSIWKLDVRGYHLTNILLHILVALAIYWLTNLLFSNQPISLFTALFFVAHPIHTEAVAYISGRADSLAFVFLLLCFILYIKQCDTKSLSAYLAMMLCYMLALLSRENALILPLILILYHYAFKKKIGKIKFISLLIVTFTYIIIRLVILNHSVPYEWPTKSTIFERLPGLFAAIANYIKLFILPYPLHMEYGNKLFQLLNIKVIFGFFIFFFLTTYALRISRKNTLVFFSISWFFITLLPLSNIYPLNAYMAEHWLYIPSVGFFLILAKGLTIAYKNKTYQILAIISVIILCAFYGLLTIRQNNVWCDPTPFYEYTLKYAPDSARAHYNLGTIYQDEGKNDEALVLYQKAIELDPHYLDAYNSLGTLYETMRKREEAILLFKKAIKINPNDPMPYNNLAILFYYEKEYGLAIKCCDKAIALGFKVDSEFLKALEAYREIKTNQE